MADALDVNLLIYKAVFDALEADAVWAELVPPGNRIRLDTKDDPDLIGKPSLADGDFNQARMRLRSGGTSLKTTDMTFGTMDDPDCPAIERLSFIYRMKLTSRLMTMRENSQLTTETVRVIRALGPRIGLPFVTGVRLRWETDEREEGGDPDDDNDAHVRQYTNLDILVDVEIDPSEL